MGNAVPARTTAFRELLCVVVVSLDAGVRLTCLGSGGRSYAESENVTEDKAGCAAGGGKIPMGPV